MSTTRKDSKASRITVACNACRTRKQKCSGKRPTCTQCLQYNRPCDWPKQLKRGPEKGYIEALEHRLHETENVLLKLLCRISDRQLSTVIDQEQSINLNHNGRSLYLQFPQGGKRGSEYWNRFPLNTAQSIRRWQRETMDQEGPRETSPEAVNSLSNSGSGEREPSHEVALDIGSNHAISESESHVLSSSTKETCSIGEDQPGEHEPDISRQNEMVIVSEATNICQTQNPLLWHHLPGENSREFCSSTPQELSLWSGAPSVNFQRQFLW